MRTLRRKSTSRTLAPLRLLAAAPAALAAAASCAGARADEVFVPVRGAGRAAAEEPSRSGPIRDAAPLPPPLPRPVDGAAAGKAGSPRRVGPGRGAARVKAISRGFAQAPSNSVGAAPIHLSGRSAGNAVALHHASDGSLAAAPAPPDAAAGQVRMQRIGPIRFEQFRHMSWDSISNAWHVDGPVTAIYSDPATSVETRLTAVDLTYDPSKDTVRAPGISTVTRPDGKFQGYNVEYNLRTGTGHVDNGTVVSDYFRMSGRRIERLEDGSYFLVDGDFTTCVHGRPDYEFHVKDMTIRPDKVAKAHNIRLYLGGLGLPAIPYYRRSLASSTSFPLPIPGYDRYNGPSLRFVNSPVERPNRVLDLNVFVTAKRAPIGFALFQQDLAASPFKTPPPRIIQPTLGDPLSGVLELTTPPTYREYTDNRYSPVQDPRVTAYGILQNQLGVYNRRHIIVAVSRAPEVGVQFVNLLGHRASATPAGSPSDVTNPESSRFGVGAAARYRAPNTPAFLNITAGVGEFIEDPSHVAAARFNVRTTLASQPLLLGRRLSARAGITDQYSVYTSGTTYHWLSPEVELNITPTRDSLFDVGYRYVTDQGSTPFVWDRRDIRHELRLQYQVSGPWAFGIATKIDLERSRAYDGELAIVRNFDCMRIGLVYQLRTSSFTMLFNLLPARKDNSRPLIPLRTKP